MPRLGSSASRALLVVSLIACAAQSSASKSESLEPLSGCPGRIGKADGTAWQEVQADGFSFCLPADWRQESRTSWRGGGGRITWGDPTGERRPFSVGRVNSATATEGVKDYWKA